MDKSIQVFWKYFDNNISKIQIKDIEKDKHIIKERGFPIDNYIFLLSNSGKIYGTLKEQLKNINDDLEITIVFVNIPPPVLIKNYLDSINSKRIFTRYEIILHTRNKRSVDILERVYYAKNDNKNKYIIIKFFVPVPIPVKFKQFNNMKAVLEDDYLNIISDDKPPTDKDTKDSIHAYLSLLIGDYFLYKLIDIRFINYKYYNKYLANPITSLNNITKVFEMEYNKKIKCNGCLISEVNTDLIYKQKYEFIPAGFYCSYCLSILDEIFLIK